MPDPDKILWHEPMLVKRVSYITPKMREIKALITLPESKLFRHIITPPIPTEIWNPRKPVEPSQMVSYANKTVINFHMVVLII